jgi:O-antigen ligase
LNTDSGIQSRLATSIPFFAILVAPLGVAGQNIGLGLALLMFIILTVRGRGKSLRHALSEPFLRQYLVLWFLIIIPIVIATFARGDTKEAGRFFWGYSFACSMVVAAVSLRAEPIRRHLILNLVTGILGFMALIAVSQYIIGWKIEGSHFATQVKRAQGFYSHPLTFAYAMLVLVPWCLARPMGRPRQWQSWALALSATLIVATTQSVTVVAISTVTFLFLGLKLLPRKQMILAGSLSTAILLAAITVPNPIAHKFQNVLSGQRGDHETSYPDDRMAFWHAHWEMFKDAPVLGHGAGLESSDRKPFYEQIGLGHIRRMYEAHNMYLQYAVEGGFVSALAFIGFLLWWTMWLRQSLHTERWHRLALIITPVVFAAGGVTQNAVQDSEVRYLLLLFCALGLWFSRDPGLLDVN